MDRSQYLTVSELTKYLKMKFDRDPYLHTVYLTGELSNFRLRQKHQYFSLKDDNAVIDAVMFEHQSQHWPSDNTRCDFSPYIPS